MKKIFLLSGYLLGTFFAIPALSTDEPRSTINALIIEGDQHYQARDEEDHAAKAISSFLKVLKSEPNHYEALWRLSRSYKWQGDQAAASDEKLAVYSKAEKYAKKAIVLNPEGKDGHLMLGIAYGRIGETRGVMKSLLLISPIKKEMKAVLDQDPQNDVAFHVLGVLYRKVPHLFGGSIRKSINSLERAIVSDPHRTIHYLELSKSQMEKGDLGAARHALESLLAVSKPTDLPQSKLDRKEAAALLRKLPPK